MKTLCLTDKHCIPCKGGVPPLATEVVNKLLLELKADWQLNTIGHLHKIYLFKDFMSAMNFAFKIAAIAEQEGHHPNLSIAWGKCGVEIWTHKINGLTESDFILAAKIEALLGQTQGA